MTTTESLKRGDKQIVALKIINELSKEKVFEDLTAEVSGQTGLDEPGARHLVRYLVKWQDAVAEGKNKTLRDQGRIIEGFVDAVPKYVDPDAKEKVIESYPNAGKAAIILMGPNGRKKPENIRVEKKTTTIEDKRGTPERRDLIVAAAKRLGAKRATSEIERLAKAGAHHFTAPDIVIPLESSASVQESEQA